MNDKRNTSHNKQIYNSIHDHIQKICDEVKKLDGTFTDIQNYIETCANINHVKVSASKFALRPYYKSNNNSLSKSVESLQEKINKLVPAHSVFSGVPKFDDEYCLPEILDAMNNKHNDYIRTNNNH